MSVEGVLDVVVAVVSKAGEETAVNGVLVAVAVAAAVRE